jgi:hypothetical protein
MASTFFEVDRAPDRGVGVLELLTGADQLDVSHTGDEHRDETLPYLVPGTEVGQCRVEVVAMVEVDDERPTHGHFSGASDSPSMISKPSR